LGQTRSSDFACAGGCRAGLPGRFAGPVPGRFAGPVPGRLAGARPSCRAGAGPSCRCRAVLPGRCRAVLPMPSRPAGPVPDSAPPGAQRLGQVFRDAVGAGGCKTGSASRCSSTTPQTGPVVAGEAARFGDDGEGPRVRTDPGCRGQCRYGLEFKRGQDATRTKLVPSKASQLTVLTEAGSTSCDACPDAAGEHDGQRDGVRTRRRPARSTSAGLPRCRRRRRVQDGLRLQVQVHDPESARRPRGNQRQRRGVGGLASSTTPTSTRRRA
jgi:hypothetical protein